MNVKKLIKLLRKFKDEEKVQVWGTVNEDGEGWIGIGGDTFSIQIENNN